MRDTPDEETTDWRAVCGKTARTVRRAGRALALPDPYHIYFFFMCFFKKSKERCQASLALASWKLPRSSQ